jgi:hypothetical protein
MSGVTIRIDAKALTAKLDALAQSQLPFAIARAITQTGLDFQKAERAHFKQIFFERRADFIEKQGVKLIGGIATKTKPSITFGIDPKASFLAKFEKGGQRPLLTGHSVMIPVDIKRNKRDIITAGNRPRPLLDRLGKQPGARGVFLLTKQVGKLAPGLYQRFGRGGKQVRLLFAREPKATIKPVLNFEATFIKIVKSNWPTNFQTALADAIRTAK